ncbi:MAG: hypothetical protein ACQEQ8_02585 [Pseudomonadota bacterium]
MNKRRLTKTLSSIVGVCILAFSYSPFAQQSSFNKTKQDGQLSFDYQWQDTNGQQQQLKFSVDSAEFLSSLERFRNYNLERANRELAHQLNRYIKQQQWRGVEVQLSPRQKNIRIRLKNARNQQQQRDFERQEKRLRDYYQQQWQHYLDANNYQYIKLPPGETGIIPDAASIAKQQQSLFKSLIAQVGETLRDNSRQSYTNFVGQFIQSIPYNELEDDINSRGDGFTPPNQLIYYNRGDCDSKSALMAAILRPIIPQAKMAIVYLPGHALFAVGMNASDADKTITVDGSTLVLMEVAGPALMPAGEIADSSAFYIDNGQYTVVEVN